MSYMMAARNRDAKADFYASHVLYGYFMAQAPKIQHSMRIYRRTVFSADEWVHVAWVWGQRDDILPAGGHTKPKDNVLTTKLYINGRVGQHYAYKWFDNVPANMPINFQRYSLEGAVDELRISDIQRYTGNFTPTGEAELTLDEHTRALFHFNGDATGKSHGYDGELPVETR